MIQEAIRLVADGKSLTMDQSSQVMDEIMDGKVTPAQLGALATALRFKGETVDEVAGMARSMRGKCLHVSIDEPVVDTCGTGGDGSNTFNISTAAAFVVAGCGVKVAKHGNRAMSGTCGSADVLETLGVNIELGPAGVQRCLKDIGFGFMFAQIFHPSMRHAAAPRKEIGIRTVFNILGPLTNPAMAKMQLIGVSDPSIGEKIAEILCKLESTHALVVHGQDGLDEISLGAPTKVWELKDNRVKTYLIEPSDLGLNTVHKDSITVVDAKESAQRLNDVLQGDTGPFRDMVLANAAGALVAADHVPSLRAGVELASKAIDSGTALNTLNDLIKLTHKLD